VATYAIGDVQGCYDELVELLDRIAFDPARDRVWLTGDLVNRGPKSLATLRFVRDLGDAAVTVLGNHDLSLIAAAAGHRRSRKRPSRDGIDEVLEAPDAAELVEWLRRRPLVHRADGHLLVHAGVLPTWSADEITAIAREVERVLGSDQWGELCANMYGDDPRAWDDSLVGWERIRLAINACTRMRFCSPEGVLDLGANGSAADAPPGFVPWFHVPDRAAADTVVVCGHWAMLGLHVTPNVLHLDSGCVWGGSLTAIRLEDRALFQVPSRHTARK
jgi:bis(5'-nucleosyl)-tetraphosphatase (symmetrical)